VIIAVNVPGPDTRTDEGTVGTWLLSQRITIGYPAGNPTPDTVTAAKPVLGLRVIDACA
jgi:hypothetical protein